MVPLLRSAPLLVVLALGVPWSALAIPSAAAEPRTEPAGAATEPAAKEAAKPPPTRASGRELHLPTREPRWRGEKISLSLRDADLVEVLRSFGKLAKVNLVIDPRVEGKVTAELRDVPWDQALYVILKTHRLAMEVDGGLWAIAPPGHAP